MHALTLYYVDFNVYYLLLLQTAFFKLSYSRLALRIPKTISTILLNDRMPWLRCKIMSCQAIESNLNTADSKHGTEVNSEHR